MRPGQAGPPNEAWLANLRPVSILPLSLSLSLSLFLYFSLSLSSVTLVCGLRAFFSLAFPAAPLLPDYAAAAALCADSAVHCSAGIAKTAAKP